MNLSTKIKLSLNKFYNHVQSSLSEFLDPKKPKWVLLLLGILLILKLANTLSDKNNSQNNSLDHSNESIETTDTFIPKGYVLVPIELTNSTGINSLMGPFTLVDIYASSENGERKGKLLAQNLRMIKAPNDDGQFAVLVNENEQTLIEKLYDPIFAVIRNPNFKLPSKIIEQPKHVQKSMPHQRISFGE